MAPPVLHNGQEVTPEIVRTALRTCIDPELGIDIVTLGLIYRIEIAAGRIGILMTLTTPGCPLAPYFHRKIVSVVTEATGVKEVYVQVTFDPPWTPEKLSADAKRQLTLLRG